MVVDDLVLLDPSEMRREVGGGPFRADPPTRGWGGIPTTADPHAALEGADLVVVQLRIGGQAARPPTRPRGLRMPGSRDHRAPVGSPRPCAPCPSSRGQPRRWRPRPIRAPGWSTSPTRGDRHPGAPRRGPPRRGPVQRGDLGPATARALSRRRPRRGRGRTCGAEPTWIRSARVRRWRRRRGAGRTGWMNSSSASDPSSSSKVASGSPVAPSPRLPPTTCTTTTNTMPRWPSSGSRGSVPGQCRGGVGDDAA